jgi:CBS domain-containing protein
MAAGSTVLEAARLMRDTDIGNVIVVEDETICGILTDRDIVVRAVADDRSPDQLRIAEVCSPQLTTVAPDDTVEDAVGVMRDKALRRLPVVEDGIPVGGSLPGRSGHLQGRRRQRVRYSSYSPEDGDPGPTLADISAAPPNI